MKQRLILAIAVVTGLLAAFLTKQYVSAKEQAYVRMQNDLLGKYKNVEAVVFSRDMPRDTLIKAEDLAFYNVLANTLRPDAVSTLDISQLAGRRTVNSVVAKKAVNWSDIEGGVSFLGSGLASEIIKTMRAFSINVSGSASVSGLVRPQDHVDVIGTFVLDSVDRPNEKEQVTLTVLQNVTVIATGRETESSMARLSAERAASYSLVTLLVTPREAETLVACEQNRGKLTLALRHPDDLGYEEELPTVDFKLIRETLGTLNKNRQDTIVNRRLTTPTTLR